MQFLKPALLILTLSAIGFPLQAKPLSLSFVELKYEDVSLSGDDAPDMDGDGLSGGIVVGGVNWYFYGEYGGGDLDGDLAGTELDVHFNHAAAGIGYQKGSETTVGYGRLGLIQYVVDISGIESSFEDTYNGYGAELGLRHAFRPNFEVGARVEYASEDPTQEKDSLIGLGVSGVFDVTKRFSLVVDYSDSSNISSLQAGVRFEFGKI